MIAGAFTLLDRRAEQITRSLEKIPRGKNMTDNELDALVVKQFIALFQDAMFCSHIAARVTCEEADTIAAMIALHGGSEAARVWQEAHSDSDDEHHIPDIRGHASGLASGEEA